jgi:hypothetical protein
MAKYIEESRMHLFTYLFPFWKKRAKMGIGSNDLKMARTSFQSHILGPHFGPSF